MEAWSLDDFSNPTFWHPSHGSPRTLYPLEYFRHSSPLKSRQLLSLAPIKRHLCPKTPNILYHDTHTSTYSISCFFLPFQV